MKVTVFGASGQTGMEIVKQALDQGHEIVGFVRDSQKMTITHDKLSVVQGDVLDAQAVSGAVQGAEAVLVALGSKPDTKPTTLTGGTVNIIAAMKMYGAKRLVIESSFALSGSPQGMAFLKAAGTPENTMSVFKPMIDDKIGQEKAVRESGLEWIIVRPLSLTNGAKTGTYRVGENLDVKPGDSVSRTDVADFMLKQVGSSDWIGKTVAISY